MTETLEVNCKMDLLIFKIMTLFDSLPFPLANPAWLWDFPEEQIVKGLRAVYSPPQLADYSTHKGHLDPAQAQNCFIKFAFK